MKKGISLFISISLVAAGALVAQQTDQSASPSGPKHDPLKPVATDDAQNGGAAGTNKIKKEHANAAEQEQSPSPHAKSHKHKSQKKHDTETNATGSATPNSNGPDASLSPSSDQTARSGGAIIHRPSASPTP